MCANYSKKKIFEPCKNFIQGACPNSFFDGLLKTAFLGLAIRLIFFSLTIFNLKTKNWF
jgi:hypothetical protein